MALIKCPYCRTEHETAAAVKACWQGSSAGSRTGIPAAVDERHPVPAVLGRNVLLRSGQPTPEGWAEASELIVSLAEGTVRPGEPLVPEEALAELEAAFLSRKPLVVRLDSDPDAISAEKIDGPVWSLAPGFEFSGERLRHFLTANSIDFRNGGPDWKWAGVAGALGASAGGSADVILPDGRPALCDGGPLAFFDAADLGGVPVVHRICLEAGSLSPPATNASTAELAGDQLAAVTYPEGAARIIAPAGSGKTRVLTERARHLLRAWNIPASAVCLVAFNKRAADEMKQRTHDLPQLQIRTLNSLGLALLNETGPFGGKAARVGTIDERGVREILDRIVSFPRRLNTDPAAAWIEAFSAVRLGLRAPSEVEMDYNGEVENLGPVLETYRSELARRQVVDFDEQIYGAVEVLLTDPDARNRARSRCRIMLVDEFQDLTPAHLLLIRTLAGPDGYVFGVGDDDQTIYGHADASPDWLIDFKRFFPSAGLRSLEVNYRCPPQVVEAAATLLTHNRRRVEKTFRVPPGKVASSGALISAATDDPVGRTADEAERALTGAAPAAVAVLTRVNQSLAPVQIALGQRGIPTNHAVDKGFLSGTYVAAALAWLRAALAPGSLAAADIAATLRRPPRRLSPRTVEWASEKKSVDDLRRLAARLDDRQREKLVEYVEDLEVLASAAESLDTAGLLLAVRDRIGLGKTAAVLDRARGRLTTTPHEDALHVLVQLGRLHPEPRSFEGWLQQALSRPGDPSGVTLATIHKVKGREWDHVIVHDATDGLMPHRLSPDKQEERRVFHVGITRGRQTVAVVAGLPESPFMEEMTRAWTPPAEPALSTARYSSREGTIPEIGMLVTDGGYQAIVVDLKSDGVVVKIGSTTSSIPYGKRIYIDGSPTRFARGPDGGVASAREEPLSQGGFAEEKLRQWRLERARTLGRPAFVILHDTTIAAIAAAMPGTIEELARIKGIGPSKLEAFGDEILAVVDQAKSDAVRPPV